MGASCSGSGAPGPTPESVADDFFAAWHARNYEAMTRRLEPRSQAVWPADRLGAFIDRRLRNGRIDGLVVRRTGRSRSADGGRAEVPFEIGYETDALEEVPFLAGTVELVAEPEGEGWGVTWRRGLLWPGVEGAAGFEVSTRWRRRGSILDASGRRLATGPARTRRYPFGSTGGSVIGHIATVTGRDAGDDGIPGRGDLVGGSGLEAAFQDRLAGDPDVELSIVDERGRELSSLGAAPGEPGRAVRTTLDIDVQRAAERAMGGTAGGAAVVDPATGDVLAAVGSGAFDPNGSVGARNIDPFNRALSGMYPPGSAMKVVTAAAALETGVVSPRTQLAGPAEYKGVRNFESGQFGSLDFASALRLSVNTAFAQVAEKLGARRMVRFANAFGFNREPAMELEAATPSFPRPADLGDLMWSSIGQARVLATPLQMATVAATVANGGKRMEPRIWSKREPAGRRAVSGSTAATLTALMEGVVAGGTGRAAAIPGTPVAGKTGTAEVDVGGVRRNHAWFIAFAPARSPRVSVAVVAELGGVGGEVAAPLARRIVSAVLAHL